MKKNKANKDTSLLPASAYLSDREKIWTAIRSLETFTYGDVERLTRCKISIIQEYVLGLLAAGFVLRQGDCKPFVKSRYVLHLDCGADAPRVRIDGSAVIPTGRTRMWQAMPILQSFTPEELANTASIPAEGGTVSPRDADYYCHWLYQGGYLHRSGRTYTCIPAMRHGPKAPQILRVKQLFDPNTGEIMTSQTEGGRE